MLSICQERLSKQKLANQCLTLMALLAPYVLLYIAPSKHDSGIKSLGLRHSATAPARITYDRCCALAIQQ